MNQHTDNLSHLLNNTSRALKWQLNRKLEGYNLTSVQWNVLNDLHIFKVEDKFKFATSAAIAQRLNIDRPTMSGVVNRLIKNGWIITEENQEDKRSQIIILTDKTNQLISHLETLSDDIIAKALKGFTEEDISVLKDMLYRIVENLDE